MTSTSLYAMMLFHERRDFLHEKARHLTNKEASNEYCCWISFIGMRGVNNALYALSMLYRER